MREADIQHAPSSHRLLAGFALLPQAILHPADAPDPDAELIRLCGRLVEIQAEDRRLCSGLAAPAYPGDDPVIGPQLDALDAEYDAITARLATMKPATLAGARALARVALHQTGWATAAGLQHCNEWERPIRPILEWLTGDH